MHSHGSRWSALVATLCLAPLAHSQQPVPAQGQQPALQPRPAGTPIKPRGQPAAKLTLNPGLSPSDLMRPTNATPSAAPAPDIKLTKFDPLAAEVRLENRRWQLWSGRALLKDFGANREAAYDARRLVAELRLSEHGAIGTPEPVMEFWLAGGQAPPVPGLARDIIPFNPKALRVLDDNGAYYVGDERHILFNFGPHEADARLALDVIHRYEFNELGLIGSPTPSMTYLLKNYSPRAASGPNPNGKPQMLPQQVLRQALDLPGLGRVGERRPIDPMKMEIHKSADGWRLAVGPQDIAVLGPDEYQARNAMVIAQRYPLTELVRLGKGDFSFYLSYGQAPRGVPLGVRRTTFQPQLLEVRQAGNEWTLGDGRQTIGQFSSADEANTALKVVRYYGFNCICEPARGLRFLAQDR